MVENPREIKRPMLGGGFLTLFKTKQSLARQEALRAQEVEDWINQTTPIHRPFCRAVAGVGSPGQVDAFRRMQEDIEPWLPYNNQTAVDRMGEPIEGAYWLNINLRLKLGPIFSADLRQLRCSGLDREWERKKTWEADNIGFPGLTFAALVFEALLYLRKGRDSVYFRPGFGVPDEKTLLTKLHQARLALVRSKEGKADPGDDLILEVVRNMGINPDEFVRRQGNYSDAKERLSDSERDLYRLVR